VTSIGVDRGDVVKASDLVATVASVETDQQYESAVRTCRTSKRNYQRAKDLVAHGWTSQQAADQAETDFTMATATVAQLATMKSYEQIRAPFDGVVTARFVDIGTLVQNSTTNKTSNQPVVTIADQSKLRIDVYVEQRDVPFVHVGDVADVTDGSNPDRKKQARVARTSDELDPRTRTLFVELEVDNGDHFLVPGSFAYVTLHIPVTSYPEVPVAGLVCAVPAHSSPTCSPTRRCICSRSRSRAPTGPTRRWPRARWPASVSQSTCPTRSATAPECSRSATSRQFPERRKVRGFALCRASRMEPRAASSTCLSRGQPWLPCCPMAWIRPVTRRYDACLTFVSNRSRRELRRRVPLTAKRKAMPKAYWFSIYRSVSNPAALADYAKLAGPAITAGGGRFLVRGTPSKTYEAGLDQRTVLIEYHPAEPAPRPCRTGRRI
jgi:uncharacterized protein (DUF1330 family)/biotin carboxyl carrier protein